MNAAPIRSRVPRRSDQLRDLAVRARDIARRLSNEASRVRLVSYADGLEVRARRLERTDDDFPMAA